MIIDNEKLMQAKSKIIDRTPDIVADLLNLEQYDSKNHKALCPFHNEDTPSFVFNPKTGYFKCFGCSKTLDIIDAYVETGKTFVEACEKVFELAEMPYSFGEKGVRTKSQYKYPKEEPDKNIDKIKDYWALRCISEDTLKYCDVRQDSRGNTVFNYYDLNDVLTTVKYKPSHKIDKSKGEIKTWAQKDADTTPLLYNMNKINPHQPLLVTEGECYKGDTQVLTKEGWCRLDEYSGQEVMQVDENLNGQFITPISYVCKDYNGDMYGLNKKNYSNLTTANHNWVYINYKGELEKREACNMPISIGGSGYIPTTIKHSCMNNLLTNDWITLWVAISADGTIRVKDNKKYNYCQLSFKKKRKVERLEKILNNLKIKYTKTEEYNSHYKEIYTYFGFRIPKWITKDFRYDFICNSSAEQKEIMLRELEYWDGNSVPNRNQIEYSSKKLYNAEFVQTLAHLCGYHSTIIKRSGKKGTKFENHNWYKVSILFDKHGVSLQKGLTKEHYEGKVYCITVPTGMILIRNNEHISVCGNCDTLAAIESGYKNSVSVPFGANTYTWIEENWDFLEQFDSIILAFDNDEAGQKALKEVIYRLGSWRTKVMDIPEIVELNGKKIKIKDINELLYRCGKEAVLNAIVNAKETPVSSVVDFADVNDVDLSDMDGIVTGYKALDKELMKLFYGTLTILTGQPSAGKSSFINQLIANSIDQEKNVWLYSREMPAYITSNWAMLSFAGSRHLKEYQNEAGSKYYRVPQEIKNQIKNWARGKLYIYKDEEPNEIPSVYQSMEDCVRKYGVKLLIIDNLMTLNMNTTEDNKYEKQTEIINDLIQFAQKYNVAVILVAHPRKMVDTSVDVGMYDVSGTSNIINLAHRSIGLRRVSKKQKEEGKDPWSNFDVVLTVIKDRIQGKNEFSMGFHYDFPSRRFFTNYDEYMKQFGWDTSEYEECLPMPECLVDQAAELYKK